MSNATSGRVSSATIKIVTGAYLRLLPVQILGIVVVALNGFIDSLITSRWLGTQALSAIGLFGPVSTVIGITWVVTIGVQILCGQEIGAGEKDKVVSLFSTGVIFLSIFSLIVTFFCLTFTNSLAEFLGGRGDTAFMLCGYIRGVAPGTIGQVLSGVLMVFLSFNNDTKRSYYGIATMVITNVGMDLLNVYIFKMGTYGMGFATTLSYLLSTLVMLKGYIGKDKTIHLRFSSLCFGRIPKAALKGLPSLSFTLGCTLKGYIINLTLINMIGDAGVAVMNVQNNAIAIVGAIPTGCAASLMTLASMYYGDEDRKSMIIVTKISLLIGLCLSVVSTAILMIGSVPISSMFFSMDDPAWYMARRMLLIFPNFLMFNLLFLTFTKLYQILDKKFFVNAITFVETLGTGVIAVILTKILGTDGVWVSYSVCELLCLFVIALTVFRRNKKITFALEDWMQLPEDFGAALGQFMEFSVHSMDEVVSYSAKVRDFCRIKQIDARRSRLARLAIEEMLGNVITHGFVPGEKHSVDVRIVAGEHLTIRIRDDCKEFDPGKYMEQFTPTDPAKNVGLRIIAGTAQSVNYQNNAGINTVLIKV